jgi:ABC-type multidrug transport system fused ATPase/permease subunit
LINDLIEYYKRENLEYLYFKKARLYIIIFLIIYFLFTILLGLLKVEKFIISLSLFIFSIVYAIFTAKISMNKVFHKVGIKTYNSIFKFISNKKYLRKSILEYEIKIVKLKLKNLGITQKNQIKEIVEYIRNLEIKKSFLEIINEIFKNIIIPILLVFIPQYVLSTIDQSQSIVEYLTSNLSYLIAFLIIIYIPILSIYSLIFLLGINSNEKNTFKWLDLTLTEIVLKFKK